MRTFVASVCSRVALAACWVLYASAVAAQQPVGRADTRLLEGSIAERQAVHAAIRDTPKAQRDPALLSALLAELARLALQYPPAVPNGLATSWNEGLNEYLISVLDTICDYEDPATGSDLLPFLRTGNRVLSTVAKFGDRAVESVGLFAETAESTDQNLSAALMALRQILVEQSRGHAISTASEEAILRVARLRLSGRQSPAVALQAIRLAAASKDASLIAELKDLSTDRRRAARLVHDDHADEIVGHVQKAAATALQEIGQ